MEPISKTVTVTRTIEKIVIHWMRDDDTRAYDRRECGINGQAILDVDGRLDVYETYLNIMSECGCTAEQSREQTAALMARLSAWKNDGWEYRGCVVTAYAKTSEGNTEEVASESLWGMESFGGKEFQTEVEGELISQLRTELEGAGWSVTDEAWNAVPRTQHEDSYGLDDADPAAYVRPLAALPTDDDKFTYRYASVTDWNTDEDMTTLDRWDIAGAVIAVCKSCGCYMDTQDDKKSDTVRHTGYCEYYGDNKE